MTQKQYDDMTSIMQFSRLFADAMYRAMDHCGLLDKGYTLEIEVEKADSLKICETVYLKQTHNPAGEERMVQFRFDEKGWEVIHDPVAKCGSIPPECCIRKKESRVHPSAENGEKPYPPDGLWIGSFNDHSNVGGGR